MNQNLTRKELIILSLVLGFIGLYVISLFVPLVKPYSRYPIEFVKCGFKQPIVASKFGGDYIVPGSDTVHGLSGFTDDFFCTEPEAQAAGYHRYPPK